MAEATVNAQAQYEDELAEQRKYVKRNSEVAKRYQNMRLKVLGWTPPTPDHENLKKFMLDQLSESETWDIHTPSPVVLMTGKKWLANHIDSAVYDIKYHTEEHQKEVERTTSRNEWIAKLYESLR